MARSVAAVQRDADRLHRGCRAVKGVRRLPADDVVHATRWLLLLEPGGVGAQRPVSLSPTTTTAKECVDRPATQRPAGELGGAGLAQAALERA